MKAGMIGLGNMGSAVANLIARNGYEVLGWDHNGSVVEEVNQHHTNSRYLAGITLHSSIQASHSLVDLFAECQVLFIAIPSVFIQGTLEPIKNNIPNDSLLVNMAKGIDAQTGLTAFQSIHCLLPDNPKIMLSGPTIANEFAREMPTVVVLAGQNSDELLSVAHLLDNDYFRTRFSDDAIGVELGGILKNIYAIGLGMFDGKAIKSINFRSVYLTIAVEEMARMGESMGAKVETFLYLAGIGDLLATAMSEHSHNRKLGELLAGGLSLEEIKAEMGVLPEGYNTLQVVLYVAEKLHVSLPLAKGLWDVINGRSEAERFIYAFIKDFVD